MTPVKENQSDAAFFRTVLAIGAIAITLFGVMVKEQMPDSTDYMSHRLIMSFTWLLLLLLSLTNTWFKKHFQVITCWLLFQLNLWAVWIVWLNDFALNYTIGLFTAFCALNITFRYRKLYYTFIITVALAWIVADWMHPSPEIDVKSTAFAITILGIVFMLITNEIVKAEKKLSYLNQHLEKKVLQRTREVEEHSRRLLAKNQELEQFAYIASHDLKSPLRTIGSYIQLIQREFGDSASGDAREYMNFVVNNVRKMHAVIDDILLYSRFGDDAITFDKVNVYAVVQEVLQSLQQVIAEKNAVIDCRLPQKRIIANEKQLTQLFQNLIDNGLKYNESEQPRIEISVEETADSFLYSVRDNGIGIKPEYYDRIFKIFQRLHSDDEYAGTGIGLAICKRIIENHRGEIRVSSGENGGTCFYFSISKNLSVAVKDDLPARAQLSATSQE